MNAAAKKKPSVSAEKYAQQVSDLVDTVEARLEAKLLKAMREIEALKSREAEREEKRRANMAEVARNARVSRAAIAADMTVEDWVAFCKRRKRDPTQFPEDALARPRWFPKAKHKKSPSKR